MLRRRDQAQVNASLAHYSSSAGRQPTDIIAVAVVRHDDPVEFWVAVPSAPVVEAFWLREPRTGAAWHQTRHNIGVLLAALRSGRSTAIKIATSVRGKDQRLGRWRWKLLQDSACLSKLLMLAGNYWVWPVALHLSLFLPVPVKPLSRCRKTI